MLSHFATAAFTALRNAAAFVASSRVNSLDRQANDFFVIGGPLELHTCRPAPTTAHPFSDSVTEMPVGGAEGLDDWVTGAPAIASAAPSPVPIVSTRSSTYGVRFRVNFT